MSTKPLFREDAYRREVEATIVSIAEKGPVLDVTVAYAQGGGQPGDTGVLVTPDGRERAFGNAVYDQDRAGIIHVMEAPDHGLSTGDRVLVRLDWTTRHRRMRVHTALHLLSCVLPYPVTGGSIGEGDGRLDFDIPEAGLDKTDIAAKLNALIDRDAVVSQRWITEAELDANPGLVKTMSVQPPRGAGVIRLVEIEGIDLQPCGGTHVARTSEIGAVEITDIEKKGKQNRRVRIRLVG